MKKIDLETPIPERRERRPISPSDAPSNLPEQHCAAQPQQETRRANAGRSKERGMEPHRRESGPCSREALP